MSRTLYSPRLSDDVVRTLYKEGKRRRMPMTRLADELILAALAMTQSPAERPDHSESAKQPAELVVLESPAA
jgi:hypothetical protein